MTFPRGDLELVCTGREDTFDDAVLLLLQAGHQVPRHRNQRLIE